jgi:hypothetical protein
VVWNDTSYNSVTDIAVGMVFDNYSCVLSVTNNWCSIELITGSMWQRSELNQNPKLIIKCTCSCIIYLIETKLYVRDKESIFLTYPQPQKFFVKGMSTSINVNVYNECWESWQRRQMSTVNVIALIYSNSYDFALGLASSGPYCFGQCAQWFIILVIYCTYTNRYIV